MRSARRLVLPACVLLLCWPGASRVAEPAPTNARVEQLRAEVQTRRREIEKLQAEVARLEAELGRAEHQAEADLIAAAVGDRSGLEKLLTELSPSSYISYAWGEPFRRRTLPPAVLVEAAEKRFRETAEPLVRCQVAYLLGLTGSRDAAAALGRFLADPDANVRCNALAALARCGPGAAELEAVRRLMTDDRVPSVRLGAPVQGPIARQAAELAGSPPQNNATVPAEPILEPPTFHCLGLEWPIEGDDNLNCRAQVEYRREGEAAWHAALGLMRVEPRAHPNYKVHPGNLLAGSIFNLSPDTAYEVRLRLADPDGGQAERTLAARTRAVPTVAADGRVRHVTPGSGGGTGTPDDPYRGIQTAEAAARPGDVMLLGPGTYPSAVLKRSGEPGRPIVWRGTDRSKVVFDGDRKADRLIQLARLKHVWLEGLTLRNARSLVSATGTEEVVVRRCRLEKPFYIGILAQGPSKNLYIADNEIVGAAKWPARKDSSYGISVNGVGHVICHNRITDCWDCISLATDSPQHVVTGALDIFGNDLCRATDDALEADYVRHNTRAFRNRFTNCLKAFSCQPVFGGPSYFLRNEIYNCTSSPYKLHVDPSGMVILHNTSWSAARGFVSSAWRNGLFRNNLILSSQGYAMETEATLADMDYDGWNRSDPVRFVKFNSVRYDTLEQLAADTGLERHGVMLTPEVFRRAAAPSAEQAAVPGDCDLRLRPGCPAADAGLPLPNVNDAFRGKGPDLGCYEEGEPVPHYGPRDTSAK